MPTYTLDGEDNEIIGTPSGDTVSGFTGGTDTVSTLGGNDRVSVIRNVPILPFVDGNGVVHYRIDYPNLGDPISGSFDGGAGIDTLHVGVTDIKDSSRDGNIIIDLTDVAISGFERLEIGYITQMTVAQLQPFTVFKGESTGLFHVILDGPGGALDLSAVTTTATLHEINGILLDSALTFTGTARADHVTDTRHADVIDGGGGNDVIFTWGEAADNLSGGAGTDTLQIYGFWPGTLSISIRCNPTYRCRTVSSIRGSNATRLPAAAAATRFTATLSPTYSTAARATTSSTGAEATISCSAGICCFPTATDWTSCMAATETTRFMRAPAILPPEATDMTSSSVHWAQTSCTAMPATTI